MQPEALTFGSLFSGCGGFDSGLEDAGLRCAWQAEIEPKRRDVLRYHRPEVPKFGDIREVSTDELAPVRLIAGGSPCQDLSVAGKREGLDGERSGLFHEFVRIADSQPAAWVLWENVDGALSSNEGRDFGIVLREFTGFWPSAPAGGWRSSGFCVGPKRWAVWRVLDSEYFGVPQRRYRIFLVGGPRDCGGVGEDGPGVGGRLCSVHPEVLLEATCLPGNPPPSRQTGAGVAGALMSGAGERGWRVGADEAGAGHLVVAAFGRNNTSGALDTSAALTSHSGRYDFESETLLAYQCHGSNVGPIGTLRKHGSVAGVPFVASTLKAHHQPSYDAAGDGPGPVNMIPGPSGVRRLTPRECERLQAYPDDWTRYGRRENGEVYELKDSPRYAMVGDGVTRTVAAWIGRRLVRALQEVQRAA